MLPATAGKETANFALTVSPVIWNSRHRNLHCVSKKTLDLWS